jgi:hypothetical protein
MDILYLPNLKVTRVNETESDILANRTIKFEPVELTSRESTDRVATAKHRLAKPHAHENCPYFPGGKIVHVGFQDPPALTKEMKDDEEILAVYRRVRDEIESFIKDMKKTLEK